MSLSAGVIKLAIEEANKSSYRYKVGAVVFKSNRIISYGHNDARSNRIHPKYQDYPNSLHAEQDALIGMDWNDIRGNSILVLRVTPTGKLAESCPCPKCQRLLYYVGINKIYYSTREGIIKYSKLDDLMKLEPYRW